ncbi:Helicase associated domain protein [Streptomyces abikoensis]|uniref:DEAD/DEAH box helicase n=1 Tax=Streptomyces abikoensis TaxID=97398 RepID=UPI0033C0D0D0
MNTRTLQSPTSQHSSRLAPRPHQQEALQAIRETADGRALVVMACGTGKSLVAREAARERSARTVLVTVPTLALAEQVYSGWAADFPGSLDALIVCSDDAVGGAGVPVTVDPERIAAFLAPCQTARLRLLISTYHSAERIAEAYSLRPLPPLDFAVLDEAHHTAGRTGKSYSVVLNNHRIPAAFRLSLTATSRIHEGSDGTADVVSMDSEALYGKRVYELPFGSAIQRKLLADYEVAIVLVSDQDVHTALNARKAAHTNSGPGDAAMVAAQIAVSRAMREHDLRSVIAFHSRVARSQNFSATLGEIGAVADGVRITSLHMDGSTPPDTRNAQLEMLAQPTNGSRVVLNNCRTLTEGVDVSSVDGVCLVDPKSSQTDIVQAVGRALRLHPEHDRPALILLPVYLAPGENPQAVLEASAFQHVWRVLATLRDQDERLDAALTTARQRVSSEAPEGSDDARPVLPEQIKIYGSPSIDTSFVEALGIHVLEHTTEDWYHWYGLLKQYVAAHGHAAVPTSKEPGTLGSWAARQRTLHGSGKLLPKRAVLLASQPGWTWRLGSSKRERGRIELEAFVAANGHTRVPRDFISPTTGYRLHSFVALARIRHKAGQMDAEEIAYYEALPGWVWHTTHSKFEQFLGHLDAFIAEHGHSRVPKAYTVQENGSAYELGLKISTKRIAYRKGLLPQWQVDTLEERSEWVWDGVAAQWEAGFETLALWAADRGSVKVPASEVVNGIRLYQWIYKQKQLIKQGKQPADRRRRLEALPGWISD